MRAKLFIRTASSPKEVQRYLEEQQEQQIGRSPACPIHIADPKLSRIHCSFFCKDKNFYIRDMNSCNGTYVNQKRIKSETKLKDGDTIHIGDTQLRFFQAENVQSAEQVTTAFQKIDDYEYVKHLGGGGIGQVFLVCKRKTGEHFALKMLSPDSATDPVMVQRFFREARACAIMDHPNLLKLFDVGMHGEFPYLVLEYAPGKALSDFIYEKRRLDIVTTLKITESLCHALVYAHQKGIIHRDIKPANVQVTDNLEVKLIDMGMVKILNESGITLSGQTLGTPRYMPPEQIEESSKITSQVDLYSLGATVYSMLAGTPPYYEVRTPHLSELLAAIISRPPIPLETLVEDIPAPVLHFVQKAMARNVKDRFRNASEMLKEIQKLLSIFTQK